VVLLHLAHEAIESALEKRPTPLVAPSRHLAENRGAFATLHLDGQLRGCVGYVFPVLPLYRAVFETARAAASQDTRFAPVTREEAPLLKISLSVLSALAPIQAEQIEIGKHGLMVTLGATRGLLLPQVPIEHRWDRNTFLEQTCRKAGLPSDAWQKGATLEAFTAEVFGDPGAPA
jgi:AmmeMemoRadiSam system protein A